MTLELINPENLPTPPTYTTSSWPLGPGWCSSPARNPRMNREHKPADSLVGVEALSRPEYLIEVEAIAVVDD